MVRSRKVGDVAMQPIRTLAVGGAAALLGYLAFFLLLQSKTLWSRQVPLPGGEEGLFGAIRRLFPVAWLNAERNSTLGLVNAGLYLLVLAWLFAAYWLTLRRLSRSLIRAQGHSRRTLWLIVGMTALVLFLLLWTPGSMSADLHNYIWYGRIWAIFGDSPFTHVPMEYAARDAGNWLSFVYWYDVPSVYGPVWVVIAGGIARLAQLFGGDVSLHLLGHKSVASLAHLVNIVLVWRIAGVAAVRHSHNALATVRPSSVVRRLSSPSLNSPLFAALIYAWNPLALIEFGANGHNDVLMLTGVLAGLWLHLAGRWRLAVAAMSLAVLVKATGLFFLACYLCFLLWQWLQGAPKDRAQARKAHRVLRNLAQALGLMLTTWAVCYLPFWEGLKTLQPLAGGPAMNLFTNSLASLVRYKGAEGLHNLAVAQGWHSLAGLSVNDIRTLLEAPLRWVVLPITVAVILWQMWRARSFERMLNALGWVLFAYLTVGAVWFWPWYVSWLLVPVALLRGGRLVRAAQLLAATSLTIYALYPLLAPPFAEVVFYRALFAILPPLVYAVVATWRVARKAHPGPTGMLSNWRDTLLSANTSQRLLKNEVSDES